MMKICEDEYFLARARRRPGLTRIVLFLKTLSWWKIFNLQSTPDLRAASGPENVVLKSEGKIREVSYTWDQKIRFLNRESTVMLKF
jgi:hypothetical protein